MLRRPPAVVFVALLAVAGRASAGPSNTASCTATRIGPHVAAQPPAWQEAVRALVRSTAEEGTPWSCVGGGVDLVVGPSGAKLTVTSAAGRAVDREVAIPDDVEPLGEALLATPLPESPASVSQRDARTPEVPAADPRVLVSAMVGPRFAGGSNLLWGGATVGAAMPFGAWGAGIWVRYDGPIASFSGPQPSLQEVSVGATAFRGFGVGPLTLRAGLKPSIAVLMHRGDRDDDRSATHVTPRIGAEAQAMIPITRMFRALVGLDAEIAPLDLAGPAPHMDPPAPRYPGYTLALGAGLEIAFR